MCLKTKRKYSKTLRVFVPDWQEWRLPHLPLFLNKTLTNFLKTSLSNCSLGRGQESSEEKKKKRLSCTKKKKFKLKNNLGNKSKHRAVQHSARITEHALMCRLPSTPEKQLWPWEQRRQCGKANAGSQMHLQRSTYGSCWREHTRALPGENRPLRSGK